jgi:hypothetical protein
MNRFNFIRLVETLKGGSSKSVRFKLVKLGNFDGVQNQKVVDVWLGEMEDYFHATKVGTPPQKGKEKEKGGDEEKEEVAMDEANEEE